MWFERKRPTFPRNIFRLNFYHEAVRSKLYCVKCLIYPKLLPTLFSSEVLSSVTVRSIIFWAVMLCSQVEVHCQFGGISVNFHQITWHHTTENSILSHCQYFKLCSSTTFYFYSRVFISIML
jgi:hypothetical protein